MLERTVGLYPNGQPGEIFIRMAKAGSTIAGLMESFGTVVSSCPATRRSAQSTVQQAVPHTLRAIGLGSEEPGYAKSIMDYLFRWLELRFLSGKQLALFTGVDSRSEAAGRESNLAPSSASENLLDAYEMGDAPVCSGCGALMVRNGSCYKCLSCGATSGCS